MLLTRIGMFMTPRLKGKTANKCRIVLTAMGDDMGMNSGSYSSCSAWAETSTEETVGTSG